METFTSKTGQIYTRTSELTDYLKATGAKVVLCAWTSICPHCGAVFKLRVPAHLEPKDAMFKTRNCPAHRGMWSPQSRLKASVAAKARSTPEARQKASETRKAYMQTPEGKANTQKWLDACAKGREKYRNSPEGKANAKKWGEACALGRQRATEARKASARAYDADGYPAPFTRQGYLEALRLDTLDTLEAFIAGLVAVEGLEYVDREVARRYTELSHRLTAAQLAEEWALLIDGYPQCAHGVRQIAQGEYDRQLA